MRHITKGLEPDSLVACKGQWGGKLPSDWNSLPGCIKRDVRSFLVAEQHSVCCYCCCRIDAHNTEIAHLRPHSGPLHARMVFEYGNMLGSCAGGRNTRRETPQPSAKTRRARSNLHCNARQGDWFDDKLTISPLDPDCERCFDYQRSGGITERTGHRRADAARETIEHLGLNAPGVVERRGVAVEAAVESFLAADGGDRDVLADGYSKPDASGELAEFCDAIGCVLKELARAEAEG